MDNPLVYELLVFDQSEDANCSDAKSLLHVVNGYSVLWESPKIREGELCIQDGSTELRVTQVKAPAFEDLEAGTSLGRAFIVRLCGSYEAVEPKRERLTKYLKDQKFDTLYVLNDQISETIACKLYPLLYSIENQLRSYLIKFMSTRMGPSWWKVNATDEMSKKAKERKGNETVFGKHVDNEAYLIDFDDLGKLVYSQSSGYVTIDDIRKSINRMEESADSFRLLKNELQSNYQKFFKDYLADAGFKEMWQKFGILRRKIAHSNLFTAADLANGQRLAHSMHEILENAEREIEDIVFTDRERENIQEFVPERDFDWQTDISEGELLSRLSVLEDRFSRPGAFVGVSYFLRHLTNLGYAYHQASKLLWDLSNRKVIDVYEVDNLHRDGKVKAVRTKVSEA